MSQEINQRIRSFLIKKPRPDIVRVTNTSGDIKDVHIEDDVRWATVARTVGALNPAVVTALNSEESVLRVLDKLITEDVPSVDTPEDPTTAKTAMHSDPMTAQLIHFGTLLAHAYKFSCEVAFEKLAERDERDMRRQEATEKRLERMEAAYRSEFEGRVRERLDGMDPSDSKNQFLEAFFRGVGGKKDETDRPDKPENGAGHSPAWGGEAN